MTIISPGPSGQDGQGEVPAIQDQVYNCTWFMCVYGGKLKEPEAIRGIEL